MSIFSPEIPRHPKLWWTTALFEYLSDHQDMRFKEVMETALPVFFPPEHKLVEPFTDEQDMADSRFWDFFIFEYRNEYFGKKTVLEFFYSHAASLIPEQSAYLKRLIGENVYSAFRINECRYNLGWLLEDLITGKTYEVSEKIGTHQTKAGDVVIGRIIPINDGWMMSPGQPVLIPMEIAVSMVNGLRRLQRKDGKKEKFSALLFENLFFSEKNKIGRDAEDITAEDPDLKKTGSRLDAFLKRYGSQYTSEKIKKILWGEKTKNYSDVLSAVTGSFKEMPSRKQIGVFLELWQDFSNFAPRQSFGGKTPAEVTEEPRPELGSLEKSLREDFFNTAVAFFNEHDYPSQKVANHVIERFKKVWLKTPQDSLSGKTPMQTILDERRKLDNHETEFGMDYFCNIIGSGKGQPTPLKNVRADKSVITRDIDFMLDYMGSRERKAIRLDGRTGDLRKNDKTSIAAGIKGGAEYADLIAKEGIGMNYIDFLISLCFAARLIKEDWLGLRVHKTNYKKYAQKTPGEKLFALFSTWYFGDMRSWAYFIPMALRIEPETMWQADHFMERRETALCHFDRLALGREKYEDFFYHFYSSKKDALENDPELKTKHRKMIHYCHVCPFTLFGLLRLNGKDDEGLPESIALTDTGVKMLPHIIDEMFLRNLDQAVFKNDIGEFLKYHQPYAPVSGTASAPNTGRNDPCPCGSGKKYKKCCLR